jgi:hypothetical protein
VLALVELLHDPNALSALGEIAVLPTSDSRAPEKAAKRIMLCPSTVGAASASFSICSTVGISGVRRRGLGFSASVTGLYGMSRHLRARFRRYPSVRMILRTALHRDRLVTVNCCFWQFRGHIGSNCDAEHCNGQTGHYYQQVWTQGLFAHCYNWCSHEQTPGVSITVTGGGDWWWHRWD